MSNHILSTYKTLVQFLGESLGPDYEIVLHDLTDENNCICAIANGNITGRKTGDALTDTSLDILSESEIKSRDFMVNYKGVTYDNRILRASTMIIRDEDGHPVGLLCINFDDSRFIDLHDTLLSVAHPLSFLKRYSTHTLQHEEMFGSVRENHDDSALAVSENLTSDINNLMGTIFKQVISSLSLPDERLKPEERIEILKGLKSRNFFKLKGAVPYVAHKLECSTATIYRYLNELSSQES